MHIYYTSALYCVKFYIWYCLWVLLQPPLELYEESLYHPASYRNNNTWLWAGFKHGQPCSGRQLNDGLAILRLVCRTVPYSWQELTFYVGLTFSRFFIKSAIIWKKCNTYKCTSSFKRAFPSKYRSIAQSICADCLLLRTTQSIRCDVRWNLRRPSDLSLFSLTSYSMRHFIVVLSCSI